MSEMFKRLDYIEDTTQDIKDNKVSNFSYTDAAYDEDNSAGVPEYSYTQEQNIPTKNHVELSQNVKDRGLRSQGASLPREAINHFFGRVSYNLNKLTDFLSVFFRDVKRAFTQNGFRYSQYARYKKGDICHVLVIENGVELMKFYLRYSNAPEEITNIAVTNSSQWQLLYESDTYTQAEGDNSTKIASTAFVTRGLATLASSLNINVATKAPINHASSATTYGEASTTLYGHVKLTASIINSAALVATSQAIYTALSGKAPTSHASSATTYGAASTVNYGHAILDTEISTSTVRVPTSNVIRLAIAVVASSVSSLTTVVNGKAPISHASSGTTYGVSSEANYGHAKASTVAGSANGTASKGSTPTVFAQSNHVHPTDTTRAPLASPTFTGNPTAPTQTAGNNSTRLATTAFVATALASGIPIFRFDYRADNPDANQSYGLLATGVPIGGIYVFRGQLYDIDDVGEWSRFLSPATGTWVELAVGAIAYSDSHGSISYRALGSYGDLMLSSRKFVTIASGVLPNKAYSTQMEIVRVTYQGHGTPDSVELHWIALRIA